jgi:molecular chaperone GrpE
MNSPHAAAGLQPELATTIIDPDPTGQESLIADLKDRWMRAEAEIANVRTRARRDVEEARLFAVQRFATDAVEGVENLRRGLDSIPPPVLGESAIVAQLRDGLAGIERNFLTLLERNGIEREEAVGTPYDASRHQAMVEQESDTVRPGTVLRSLSGGWTLHGRLLRPAMVVVAKAPPPPTETSRIPGS